MRFDEFEAYFQASPNLVVLRGLKQHVVVTSRNGQVHDFMLEDAAEVARRCQHHELESGRLFRLRRYWGDNRNGNARALVHIFEGRRPDVFDVARFTWPTTTKNGQTLDVVVRVLKDDTGSDRFEANAESYYDQDFA